MRAAALALVLVLATAAAPAAAAQRPDRLEVPVPHAGDVTLVRARVDVRGPPTTPLSVERINTPLPAGGQIAVVGREDRAGPARRIADLLVAVGVPAASHGPGATTLTLRFSGRRLRPRLLRRTRAIDARYFAADASCGDLAVPLLRPTREIAPDTGAWSELGPRAFAEGALAWGCPSRGLEAPAAFAAPMANAYGPMYLTWTPSASGGLSSVCVYLHDVAGVRGQVVARVPGAAPLAVPYEVPNAGVMKVVFAGFDAPSVGISLERERVGIRNNRRVVWERNWTTEVAAPPGVTQPPATPVDLAEAAGPCG